MVCMEIVELMHMQQVELAAICTGGDSASGTDDLNPDAVSSSGGGGGGGAAGGVFLDPCGGLGVVSIHSFFLPHACRV